MSNQDILTESDSKDKKWLEKYFDDIKEWDISTLGYKQDSCFIEVYQSFVVKDKLKKRSYKYSSLEQVWLKEMSASEAEEEKMTVAQWIDEKNIQIEQASTIKIESYYLFMCF